MKLRYLEFWTELSQIIMPLYNRLGFKTRKLKGKKLKEVTEIIKWNQQEI